MDKKNTNQEMKKQDEIFLKYLSELTSILKKENPSKKQFNKIKTRLCKKYKLKKIPTEIEIALHLPNKIRNKYNILQTKPSRIHSGVNAVAIMTKPHNCPHGKCITCPGGPESEFGTVPQSYTGKEPATRRAIRNNYDPYLQVFNRLEQYIAINTIPDKIELIIMGGTFPSTSKRYQNYFVRYAFKAMNDFSKLFFKKNEFNLNKFKEFFELPSDINNKEREKRILKKIKSLKKTCKLDKEQKKNEKSFIKCVGLTIETRPDYAKIPHINQMLKLGATRVELGVQTTDNKILKKINRGHSIKQTIEATKALKDLGYKINYHIMPGLPGSNLNKDLETFKQIFTSDFQPDMLKIYPCMVLKGTKLYDLWQQKKFKPLTTKKAIELLKKAIKLIPHYVRIMRIQRDIPTFMTESGVDKTNLRQLLDIELKKENIIPQEIRFREIKGEDFEKYQIRITNYQASKGEEFFIEALTKKFSKEYKTNIDRIIGFCRLRFPSQQLRKEITINSAIIRELHVYGKKESIGTKGKSQHRGIGKELVEKAEEIAIQNNKTKMIIISAIGTRNYYKKLGYKLQGPYMVKKLN